MNCKLFLLLPVLLLAQPGFAEEFITSEPDGKSYHYVNSYRITIDAPVAKVWPQVVDLGSWMKTFDMLHHTGKKGEVGEVLKLRESQEAFIQITAKIDNQLLAFGNIPSTYNGEQSTGSGFISLVPTDAGTVVTLSLSTRFTWLAENQNFMKLKRESREFQEQSSKMWNGFLSELAALVKA